MELKKKKKEFTKTNNQFWLNNALLKRKITRLKVKNSNSHNIENTHFAAENTYFTFENAKLTTKVAEMKWLTYFNELDLSNATKTIILKGPAVTYLLFSKVEKLTKLADSLKFNGNKHNKTINVEDWINKIEYKLKGNKNHFLID